MVLTNHMSMKIFLTFLCCFFLSLITQAVEKVLAGAIRREMELEDLCAKQTSEIAQLKRLVWFLQVW